MPDQPALDKPGLAIIGTAITPYHVNLYRAIAARIPELRLHILVTHGAAEFKWQIDVPPDFAVVKFGVPGDYYLDAFLLAAKRMAQSQPA